MGHGRVVVAVLGVLLAFPAAAMGDGLIRYQPSSSIISYDDFDNGVDDFVVTAVPDPANGNALHYGFRAADLSSIAVGSGCVFEPDPLVEAWRCDQDTSITFFLDLKGGDDVAGVLSFAQALPLVDRPTVIFGGEGDDQLGGGLVVDTIDGGPGDDRISPLEGGGALMGGPGDDVFNAILGDVTINGDAGRDFVDFTSTGAGEFTLDGVANDGPNNANVMPDVEDLDGTGGHDRITGSALGNRLRGMGGDDVIVGGAGPDTLDGGPDDDTVFARDDEVDAVACGQGIDQVFADWNDVVDATCEPALVSRSVRDDDADGSPHDQDCNDANPGIRPGVNDFPTNGIDEDCSGADLDADGDGIIAPADCDDNNAAIKPGARDVPRNGINEDCRGGGDADFAANRTRVANSWVAFTDHTTVAVLRLRQLPSRARVQVRCTNRAKGCPFEAKRLRVRNGRANATSLFKGARLQIGAVIEIRITARDTMGRVFRYTMRSRKLPARRELCLTPGRSRPGRC